MPQPISDLANILAGEECVTASCWKPQLNHLHFKALVEKEKDTTVISNIQQRIHENKMLSCIIMSIEECVKEVLSHYLGCNQPEINSSPFK